MRVGHTRRAAFWGREAEWQQPRSSFLDFVIKPSHRGGLAPSGISADPDKGSEGGSWREREREIIAASQIVIRLLWSGIQV